MYVANARECSLERRDRWAAGAGRPRGGAVAGGGGEERRSGGGGVAESAANPDALLRSRYWRLHSSLPKMACGFSRGAHTVSVHLRLGDLIRPTLLAPQTRMTGIEHALERRNFRSRATVSVNGFQNVLEILTNATAALGAPVQT